MISVRVGYWRAAFNGWYNHLQFDAPGTNSSDWQQIWEIKEVLK